MNMRIDWKRGALAVVLPAMLGVVACSDDTSPAGPGGAESLLLSVEPRGGSTGVSTGTSITITFDHPMNPAMSAYASVHEGTLTGAEVEGTSSWSAADTKLTFTPASPLEPATTYVIHLGGGMRDAEGRHVDFQQHGGQMGGQWATSGMMGGGMAGGPGPGHMGDGWQHPSNGSYGMAFVFTTA